MPKGGKRIELKNETITIVNCHLCDYKVMRKCPQHTLRKYLKLHYKSAHHQVLTDKDIDGFAKHICRDFKMEMGGIESGLIQSYQQAVINFNNVNNVE